MGFVLVSAVFVLDCVLVSGISQQPTQLTLEVLYEKVKSLTKEHPDLSTLMEIGRSVENRPIYAVRIQKGTAQDSTVVLEFGIHARELASPASGLFLLEKFLENPACEGLLERIRWYVIPVLNPDGYKYAVETGQLWRKNRELIPTSDCVGIDLNRNFPVGWENLTQKQYFCDETYCGQMPISEPESVALKKFLDDIIPKEKVKAYLAVHTCASGMFYPYGYKSEKADNYVELEKVGELMKASIRKVAGKEYDVGPAYKLGIGGGGVDEFVYDTYHVPLVRQPRNWSNLFLSLENEKVIFS